MEQLSSFELFADYVSAAAGQLDRAEELWRRIEKEGQDDPWIVECARREKEKIDGLARAFALAEIGKVSREKSRKIYETFEGSKSDGAHGINSRITNFALAAEELAPFNQCFSEELLQILTDYNIATESEAEHGERQRGTSARGR